jgi:hypothetical protein
VLLAAGIYLSVLRLPALDDLWTTGYGHVLIVKLSLVALALVWGGFHHFVVEPRLSRPGVAGRVRGSLAGETAVGLAVLLVAAFLVNSKRPARPSAPPTQAIAGRASGPGPTRFRRPAQAAPRPSAAAGFDGARLRSSAPRRPAAAGRRRGRRSRSTTPGAGLLRR